MPKKKKPTYAKQLEKVAKEFIHLRDKETCQHCGSEAKGLHVSHVHSRRFGILKWDESNLKLLCYKCHIHWWHKEPVAAAEWFMDKFPERHKYLSEMRQKVSDLSSPGVDYYKERIESYKEKVEALKPKVQYNIEDLPDF